MYADSGPHRKLIGPATSSAVPSRRNGTSSSAGLSKPLRHLGVDDARRNRVAAYPVRTAIPRQVARHPDERRFRRRVLGADDNAAAIKRHRAHDHDAARVARAHAIPHSGHAVARSLEVHVHDVPPLLVATHPVSPAGQTPALQTNVSIGVPGIAKRTRQPPTRALIAHVENPRRGVPPCASMASRQRLCVE